MVDVGQVNEVGDNAEDIPKLICASGTSTMLAVMMILRTYVTGARWYTYCCS